MVALIPNVEPVLSVEAITVLEPTARNILFPYAMEFKVVETCEFMLDQLEPLSVDFISFPLEPTEMNRLLPCVIPYNELADAPDVREVQLEPLSVAKILTSICNKIKPDLWEFHLSYSDMDLDLSDYFKTKFESDFVVHAPELFAGSHLMDLATPDQSYREESLKETQRVIDITRELKKFFPKTKKPMIVANIGGFTMDKSLDESIIPSYYEQFSKSLEELDMDGIELIPQTMAPFPWHFGGQRYQNMFVKIDEITEWATKLNLRMCFDVSHTQLTCNHYKLDFYDFARKIAPFTAHLHLGDAKGVNGEGLQVGDGDIDFDRLGAILKEGCPNASFIPEIWQGHKNRGEGFWVALNKLEEYF